MDKRVFFLMGQMPAFERFVRRKGSFPEEAMPSVYLPWLRYKKRGYDVHVFMIGKFDRPDVLPLEGCSIHLIRRPLLSRLLARMLGRWLGSFARFFSDNICLYQSAATVAQRSPSRVVYSYTPWYAYAAWLLGKRYRCHCVKRIFGTPLYDKLFHKEGHVDKSPCILEKVSWLWPADTTIITNDGSYGDKVADFLGIKKDRYRFWLNGVDKTWTVTSEETRTLRNNIGLSANHFVLLCVSRLSPTKRQDRVVKALKLLVDDLPNVRLVFAGDGPIRTDLERLVADLRLVPFVTFVGMVPHNKAQQLMGIADVFLQTNDYSCLGNTLLEAMACGCTIVTWDVAGTSQVVIDGETGCLLPDPEPSTIAKAVVSLAKNPEKAKRLGRNARKFAEEKLQSWDERLDREIDLVEKLCCQGDRKITFWPLLKHFSRGILGRNNHGLQRQEKITDFGDA